MEILLNILIVIGSFILMEGITWLTHKYIMHGFLWSLHHDHHNKDHDHDLERNDLFFLIFGIPGFLLCFFGMKNGYDFRFFIGLGVTLYGMAYLLVHDVFIHQRINLFRNSTNPYFMALRRAHKMHHKHLGKEEGECFGMLYVPWKYIKEARERARRLSGT